MRALGALLILFACGGIGLGWTARQKGKIALLEALRSSVEALGTELTQRGTPLPEILEKEARRGGRLAACCARLAEALRQGTGMARAAEPFLERLEELELAQAVLPLAELCQVLGRYDAPTQGAACGRCALRLEALEEEQRRLLQEKGRLYHTVPLALGAMAALVIW